MLYNVTLSMRDLPPVCAQSRRMRVFRPIVRLMISLTYVSSAVALFSRDALHDLLQQSRKANDAVGVTGLLLYRAGNFMQVLEGEEPAVQATFQKIQADPRHRGILILLQQKSIQTREFDGWSMAFRDLSTPSTRALPGFDEFLNTPLTDQRFTRDPSFVGRLLQVFKSSM